MPQATYDEKIHRIEMVSASMVRHGDTIHIDGHWRTIHRKNIKNGFMGITILGQPLEILGQKVPRMRPPQFYKGELKPQG